MRLLPFLSVPSQETNSLMSHSPLAFVSQYVEGQSDISLSTLFLKSALTILSTLKVLKQASLRSSTIRLSILPFSSLTTIEKTVKTYFASFRMCGYLCYDLLTEFLGVGQLNRNIGIGILDHFETIADRKGDIGVD